MQTHEFDDWMAYHQAAFPGVAAWFAKIPAASRPQTLALWERALSKVALAEAKAATDSMFSESNRPKYYEEHPAAILTRIRRDRPVATFKPRRFVHGEEVYSCPTCMDIGHLVCWHPIAMKHYRDRRSLDGCAVRSCAKACTCAAGDPYARSYGRYDPKHWLIIVPDVDSVNLNRLRDFINAFQPSKPANYETAFDQFSGKQQALLAGEEP
jgi:hypothetical protein